MRRSLYVWAAAGIGSLVGARLAKIFILDRSKRKAAEREKARLERARIEQQRLQEERLRKQRAEAERLEKQRQEQERREQAQLEPLQCERMRSEREQLKSRDERERLQQLLDQDRPTSELIEQARCKQLLPRNLMLLLEESLNSSAAPLLGNWWSRHWPDLILLGAVASLITLAILGVQQRREAQAAPEQAQQVVLAARELMAFIPLSQTDLTVAVQDPQQAQQLTANLVGHYPTSTIKAGEVVEGTALSTRAIDLSQHSVMQIALKQPPLAEPYSFPTCANLMLSTRATVLAGTQVPVSLLALDDGTAIVAIPEDRLPRVAELVGSSDAYLQFPGIGCT